MNKSLMVNALVERYAGGNKAKFAKMLGISPQTISAWVARNTFDPELIYTKCSDISPEWLLSGQGGMLRENGKQESPSAHLLEQLLQERERQLKEKDEMIALLKDNTTTLKKQVALLELQIETRQYAERALSKNAASSKEKVAKSSVHNTTPTLG